MVSTCQTFALSSPMIIIVLAAALSVGMADFGPVLDGIDGPLLADITAAHNVSDQEAFSSLIAEHRKQMAPNLRPILNVLPKNKYQKLDSPAVRYVLHRFFLQQHGWRVEGLDPEGSAWNSSSAAKVVALERLPAAGVQQLARRLGDEGFTEDDAITLAATIETYVHAEAVERLKEVFRLSGMGVISALTAERAANGIELYMSSFIMGANLSRTSGGALQRFHRDIAIQYPAWPKTREFLHDVALAQNISAGSGVKVNFTQVASVIENITDLYGRWQNYECIALKKHLVELEDHGTGRVRLSEFYGVALGGKWQFSESVPYLRELGALDESNPNNLRVIIPNYVNGASNCVGASKYGSLCCISECWDIFAQFEMKVGAAEASPNEVAAAVAAIPSSTVQANRVLSPLSLIRLKSIASNHDGTVPIHGRLFAQWLHHVYPRECDFPHRAGTTKPADLYDMEGKGENHRILASNEDMKHHSANIARLDAPLETMAWSFDEELLVTPDHDPLHPVAWVWVQSIATCAALVTMCMGLTRSGRLVRTQASARTVQKVLYAAEDHMTV